MWNCKIGWSKPWRNIKNVNHTFQIDLPRRENRRHLIQVHAELRWHRHNVSFVFFDHFIVKMLQIQWWTHCGFVIGHNFILKMNNEYFWKIMKKHSTCVPSICSSKLRMPWIVALSLTIPPCSVSASHGKIVSAKKITTKFSDLIVHWSNKKIWIQKSKSDFWY